MQDDFSFDIDIRQIINLAVESFRLITLIFLIFLALGIFVILSSEKIYKATALIEVPLQAENVVAIEDVSNQDFRSLEVLKTIEQSFVRDSLFLRVIGREDIRSHPHLTMGMEKSPEEVSDRDLVKKLGKWTQAALMRGTRIIEVSVEHPSPEVAALLANALVKEYEREKVGNTTGSSQSAFSFLYDEAAEVREKLQKSEEALQDFEKAVDIREKIEEQEDVINELEQRYRDKHPALIQARSLLDKLQQDFQLELIKVSEAWKEKGFWEEKAQAFEKLSGPNRVQAELKLMEAQFNVITREVEADRALYESLITRMKETDVTRGLETDPIILIDPAMEPSRPVKPNKPLILLFSLFAAGCLSVALIVLRTLLDSTLKTVEQAEQETALSVLGAIPDDSRIPDVEWMKNKGKRILENLIASAHRSEVTEPDRKKKRRKKEKIEPLVLLSDPGSHMAEAIRSLRASVKLLGKSEEQNILLITSSIPGEGKSFVSSNLALCFAQEGQRTLLIDGDLRRPMIAKFFNLGRESSGIGLVNCLIGEKDLEACVVKEKVKNLDILPVGPLPPNPAELFAGSGLETVLEMSRDRYDRVIIDSAPVNAVADSLLIAPKVKSSLLVCQASKTSKGAVNRAIQQLTKAGKKPVGLILNRLPSRSGLISDPYYYYYSSDRDYGNNYGS